MITSRELPILERKEIATNTIELTLDLEGRVFLFEPGQYIDLTIENINHSFSIASSPTQKQTITIAFRLSESPFKQALMRVPNGARIEVRGPLGTFTLPHDNTQPKILVAGGIGITPFMSIIRTAAERAFPTPITLLYANRTKESAAYLKELQTLASHTPRLTLHMIIGPLSTTTLHENIQKNKGAQWYIAGPADMVTVIYASLREGGVDEHDIRTEEFTGYKDMQKIS